MSWIKTSEAGIYRHETIEGKWKVRATATDPRTGEICHRRKTLKESTLQDALATREELKERIQSAGSPTLRKSSIAHFALDWAEEMIREGRWNSSTADTNVTILKQHILPVIGHIEVTDLNRADIRRWIDKVESARYDKCQSPDKTKMVPYAHGSLRRWWRVLKHLIKALYLEAHCDRRMVEWCREIRGPQGSDEVQPRREQQTLTRDELEEFVEEARVVTPTRYAEIVTLAFTGMRAGELYGLENDHLDFDENSIFIEQSYSKGELRPTKTGMKRWVPMTPRVAEAIQQHRSWLIRKQNLGLHDGIVFPSMAGTRREASSLHRPMQKVADSCGIDVRVGPQVLRSTFTTLLNNLGVKRSIIMSMTGHDTDQMNDHYTRPRSEDQQAAVLEVFGSSIG